MPADGRYSSLGRCKGTIRIGSFSRGIFLALLLGTLVFVMFLRFTVSPLFFITILNWGFHEELQRRNYSAITTRNYLRVVADFGKYFGNSPETLLPTNFGPIKPICCAVEQRRLEARFV